MKSSGRPQRKKQTRMPLKVIIPRAMKSKTVIPLLQVVVVGLIWLQLWACSADRAATDAATLNPAPDPALLAQADDAYAHRAEPERLRAGLDVLKRARAVAPANYDAAWRLARLVYTLGDGAKDDNEREAPVRQGVQGGGGAAGAG